MLQRQFTGFINGTDCIGDSRLTINQNFSALDIGVQELSTLSFTSSGITTDLRTDLDNLSISAQTLETNITTVSTSVNVLSAEFTNLQTSFNTSNIGPSATLTTHVSSLSVYTSNGDYIGFIPIYIDL